MGEEVPVTGSYLADPTSPIPSHCASIVVTSTVRVNSFQNCYYDHRMVMYRPTSAYESVLDSPYLYLYGQWLIMLTSVTFMSLMYR